MNDLDTLRELRADLAAPGSNALASARARLLDHAFARAPHVAPRRRVGRYVAATAAVALVVAGAVVTGYERFGPTGGSGAARPVSPSADPSQPAPDGTAQGILALASRAALAMPAAQPRAGQYRYRKEMFQVTDRTTPPELGDGGTYESWARVGGGPGRVRIVYDGGHVEDHETSGAPLDDPDYAGLWPPLTDDVLARMPTDAAAMREFVHQNQVPLAEAQTNERGNDSWPPSSDFDLCTVLLWSPLLSPEQRAAAFEAVGQLPDVSLDEDVVDSAGRHGVGIVYDGQWRRTTLIIDRDDHQLLGYIEEITSLEGIPVDVRRTLSVGSSTSYAVVDRGIVDSVDERP